MCVCRHFPFVFFFFYSFSHMKKYVYLSWPWWLYFLRADLLYYWYFVLFRYSLPFWLMLSVLTTKGNLEKTVSYCPTRMSLSVYAQARSARESAPFAFNQPPINFHKTKLCDPHKSKQSPNNSKSQSHSKIHTHTLPQL